MTASEAAKKLYHDINGSMVTPETLRALIGRTAHDDGSQETLIIYWQRRSDCRTCTLTEYEGFPVVSKHLGKMRLCIK